MVALPRSKELNFFLLLLLEGIKKKGFCIEKTLRIKIASNFVEKKYIFCD